QGSRRGSDLMKAICEAYAGSKPAVCNDIPEARKVNVTILSDTRCAPCDSTHLEGILRQRIANPNITSLDYNDAAGKKLFGALKNVAPTLPAAVFDASLDPDKEAAQSLASAPKPAGGYAS